MTRCLGLVAVMEAGSLSPPVDGLIVSMIEQLVQEREFPSLFSAGPAKSCLTSG